MLLNLVKFFIWILTLEIKEINIWNIQYLNLQLKTRNVLQRNVHISGSFTKLHLICNKNLEHYMLSQFQNELHMIYSVHTFCTIFNLIFNLIQYLMHFWMYYFKHHFIDSISTVSLSPSLSLSGIWKSSPIFLNCLQEMFFACFIRCTIFRIPHRWWSCLL